MHALPLLICNNNVVDKSIKDITTIGDLKCSNEISCNFILIPHTEWIKDGVSQILFLCYAGLILRGALLV